MFVLVPQDAISTILVLEKQLQEMQRRKQVFTTSVSDLVTSFSDGPGEQTQLGSKQKAA